MAGEWKKTTIGEHIDLATGGAFQSARFGSTPDSGTLLARGDNVKEGEFEWGEKARYWPKLTPDIERNLLQEGDVLLGMDGSKVGKNWVRVRKKDLPCLLVQRVARLRAKSTMDQGFLRFLIGNPEFRNYVERVKTGTTIPHISGGQIKSYEILLPSLPDQKAIASVLGSLDDKIELNRRMNATLGAMARALFQSWFVDFDPVRAKLDGRAPVGLDATTAALFPEHFSHGERDLLPVGWRLVAIEEVCDINTWTLSKNDELESLEYIEISEVSRGNIADIATYRRGEEPSRARRRLRHGDTVLSTVRPDRGSYFLALDPPENRVASTGFAVLTPTIVPWSFVHAALTRPEVSEYLGQMADGGAYPAVRPEIIGAIQIAVPNEQKILDAFHRICAPLYEQSEANRIQSRTLATLRDTLLPKLLSGELSAN